MPSSPGGSDDVIERGKVTQYSALLKFYNRGQEFRSGVDFGHGFAVTPSPLGYAVALDPNAPITRAPVRAIQTAAFPGTYSAGVWTVTGSLTASTFDGLTIAVGESVEISQGTSAVAGTSHIGNGLYSRTSATEFTRRADLDSDAKFSAGVAYEVLDGASQNRGTRRQLTTQGVVTLDTTPISFGQVRDVDYNVIDVTRPPYNLRLDQTDKVPRINAACWAAAQRYASSGHAQAVQLPGPEMIVGLVGGDFSPIWVYPGVRLRGGGRKQTRLSTYLGGGSVIVCGSTGEGIPVVTGTSAPDALPDATALVLGTPSATVSAVVLVSTTNIAALSGTQTISGSSTANKRVLLIGQTNPAENGCYFATAAGAWVYDFTTDADVVNAIGQNVPAGGPTYRLMSGSTVTGAKSYAIAPVSAGAQPFLDFSSVRFLSDANFSWDICFATNVHAAGGFTIGMCRGRLRARDSLRTLFSCSVSGAGAIAFSLRTTDPSGALTASGPGAPPTLSLSIVGSGNATSSTQLVEGQAVRIECTKGGARGTAEFRYSWFDGHSWVWHAVSGAKSRRVLSAATVVLQGAPVINSPTTGAQVAQGTVTLNMGAGTYVAGQSWANNPTTTVTTAAGVVATNKKYYLSVEYQAGRIDLWCQEQGVTMGAPRASATGVAGLVSEFPFERFVMGAQVNFYNSADFGDGLYAPGFILGGTRLYRVAQRGGSFVGAAPITVSFTANLGTQSLLHFQPSTYVGRSDVACFRGDGTIGAYGCLYRNARAGNVVCQLSQVPQTEHMGVEGLEIYCVGASADPRLPLVRGILARSTLSSVFGDLSCTSTQDGLELLDPSYYSKIYDLNCRCRRFDLALNNAGLISLEGSNVLNGSGYALFMGTNASVYQSGYTFVGPLGGPNLYGMIFEAQALTDFQSLVVSEEGSNTMIGGLHLSANIGQRLRICGQSLLNYSDQAAPLTWGVDGYQRSDQGTVDMQMELAGPAAPTLVEVLDPGLFRPASLVPGFGSSPSRKTAFCEPTGMVLPYAAAPAERGEDLADASLVISPGPQGRIRVMPAATATATRTITLDVNRNPKLAATLLANFTQPAAGVEVSANVSATAGWYAGTVLRIEGGGRYQVVRVDDATHATLVVSAIVGNAAPGATVTLGAKIGVSQAITTVNSNFTQPAVGATVSVPVTASAGITEAGVSWHWYIRGAGFYSASIAPPDATHVTLTNLGGAQNAAPGASVGNGQLLVYADPVTEGDIIRIFIAGAQANTLVVANGGPAGGTILSAAAGMVGALDFRLGATDWSLS